MPREEIVVPSSSSTTYEVTSNSAQESRKRGASLTTGTAQKRHRKGK